jgi:hypothetical protein
LATLEITDSNFLQFFSELKSLKKITFSNFFDTIKNIDEIFDPSKILELEVGDVRNAE